jgi:pyruvate dehydrogenase E2 component (dihydrolipoamide acetyltransferase)
LALRQQINAVSPTKISVNDLIIKAVAIAHVAVPAANVTWTEDAMRRYDAVDVGVAIAAERGLVTPVLRAVESCSLSPISAKAKAGLITTSTAACRSRDRSTGPGSGRSRRTRRPGRP